MVWNKKISALLAVVALCGVATVGAVDYTILEKAEKVETTVYGTTQTGALNTRIAALDKVLNGSDSVSGSVDSKTDELYKEVYGNTGSDLSMVAAVNMMQRQYSGTVTNDALTTRVGELEEGISGKVGTGSLRSRVAALRSAMLGKRKFVSQVVTIPAGTVVEMTNEDPINSKDLTEGDRLRFSVAEDIKVGDVIAIPRGMEAEGTVSKARKAGRFGRDGKIEIEYDSVHASDGSPVQLVVGEKTKEQYKRIAGAVGASAAGAIILGPVGLVGGLFVKGNNVDIPAGSTMYAETKHDADVVGFKSEGGPNTMETADMAASGVVVPGTNEPATTVTESPASPQVEKPSAVQKPEQAEVPEKTETPAPAKAAEPEVTTTATNSDVRPVDLDDANDETIITITPTEQ